MSGFHSPPDVPWEPVVEDENRCSHRKHVIENNKCMCDCGRVIIGPTVAGNARVVTLLYGFEYTFTVEPNAG